MADPRCPMNPADDGAEMSFNGRMSYNDYLHTDAILTAQHPATGAHDELLFIIHGRHLRCGIPAPHAGNRAVSRALAPQNNVMRL